MLNPTFYWWLIIFVLGLINLPLTWTLFVKFYDRGYAFAKIISLVLVSYLVWLLAILKLLPFTRISISLSIALIILLNLYLIKRRKQLLVEFIKGWRVIIFEECLFVFGLFFWAHIRSFQPDINGLEKFMDFGFVNAILRSRFFPPNDMWLAGNSINYYYFGHYQTALLTRISGIASAITYNLMLATICGQALSAGFSITSNLIKWSQGKKKTHLPLLIGGLLSAFMLTFGGNWQILYHWFTEKTLKTYWYPDATRFIVDKFGAADNTIHEFPSYSLVVSDLHGHFLNLPTALLMIALIITLLQRLYQFSEENKQPAKAGEKLQKIGKKIVSVLKDELGQIPYLSLITSTINTTLNQLPLLTFLALMLGIAFMTNAWDYPIYLLYAGAAILSFNYLTGKREKVWIDTVGFCSWLVLVSIIASLPFHLNFKNIAQGIALVDFHSPPWMLLFLWGFPLFNSICFVALIRKNKKVEPADYLVLTLIIVSWLLIAFPEILRVKDIYAHNHQRANTMFKLTYQAFVVFYLLSGYIFVRILTGSANKGFKKAFFFLFAAGAAVIISYPRFAIRSYYGDLKTSRGLDGTKYLSATYPNDYQAITWLNENVKDDPVIVEAVGESYTDYARVSANTGLPTILGWRVHEWLWRGTFDISAARTEEVKKIYTSQNLEEVKELLQKYQVRYIFVGTLEKEAYPDLSEEVLSSLGKVIFSSGNTKIYEIYQI
ncbi:MAG TPA: DUF2298 domain-containing protein [Candidatus Bathyarchaeia archaeon]|nr:DUF2298 domain-containing protein [Candidatus Bathyarchaeia archaeon]